MCLKMLKIHQYRSEYLKHKTASEIALKPILKEVDKSVQEEIILGRYRVDFLLPSYMLVIEIDGAYHKNKLNYDLNRDKFIVSLGFDILRLTNEESKIFDFKAIKKTIRKKPYKQFKKSINISKEWRFKEDQFVEENFNRDHCKYFDESGYEKKRFRTKKERNRIIGRIEKKKLIANKSLRARSRFGNNS